jgi:hypothetical protein
VVYGKNMLLKKSVLVGELYGNMEEAVICRILGIIALYLHWSRE